MLGSVPRSSKQKFELQMQSPIDCVLSQRPDTYEAEPFRPLRRPRATQDDSALPPARGGTCEAAHQESWSGIRASGVNGLPPSSPAGSHVTSVEGDGRLHLSNSHSPDIYARSAALPSPDMSGDIVLFKGDSPGATGPKVKDTLRLLTAVVKANGGRLSSGLPPSVQAEIDYVSRFDIRDRDSIVNQLKIAFTQPKSGEEFATVTKELDSIKLLLKDLKQGLIDSVVATADVDYLLSTFSRSQVLNRAKNALKKVLCGHPKNAEGAVRHGRSIIETFYIATDLHSKNVAKKLQNKNVAKKGFHRDGFLVHYLYNSTDYSGGEGDELLERDLDKLDVVLDDLRTLDCDDPEDKAEVKRLTNRLAATATGKLMRITTGQGSDVSPTPSSSSKKGGQSYPQSNRAVRGRGFSAKLDFVQKLAKSQTSVDVDAIQSDPRECKHLELTPLVIRNVSNYQVLKKRVYIPNPARQKSILSGRRPKLFPASVSRISFSGPVSAVEIEHCADRRNYDGCDPLRPADQEHEEEVKSRSVLLSRRACLALGMVNEFDISNRHMKASGLQTKSTRIYRMTPLNP